MKKLIFLLSSLALASSLACTKEKPNTPDTPSKEPIEAEFSLKAMSFNIRYSNSTDLNEKSWNQRRKPCVDLIKAIGPGVIGMQESRTDQREYLKAMLSKYTLLEVPGTGTGKGANATVLYQKDTYNCIDWGYFYLSATPDIPSTPWNSTATSYKNALWAHLQDKASGQEFFFVSTHFQVENANENDNDARLKSAQLIVDKMKELAEGLPVIVVGDLNCSNDPTDARRTALAPFYQWMLSAREKAPMSDNTYSFNNFGSGTGTGKRNLDHIFYRNLTAVRFQTIDSDNFGVKYVSDHYPIMLTARGK